MVIEQPMVVIVVTNCQGALPSLKTELVGNFRSVFHFGVQKNEKKKKKQELNFGSRFQDSD